MVHHHTQQHGLPEPMNVVIFGERVFADVTKLRMLKRSFWITQVIPKPNDKHPHVVFIYNGILLSHKKK
jgi:hypothetical protein